MISVQYSCSDLRLRDEVESFIRDWGSATEHVEVFTSGSTGSPKKIILAKEHMRESARMTGCFLGLKKGDTALLCLSPSTIGGKMMMVRAFVLGLHLVVVDIQANPLASYSGHIDFAAMVPLQVQECLVNAREQLASIGTLLIGGAPISNSLAIDLGHFPHAVWQSFGMTETISHIALRSLSPPSPFYTALPGVHLNTEDGKLLVDAPALGVYQMLTNDLVALHPEGFEWLGRADFVINSGGIKIHPEKIEALLDGIISVPFFSIGLPDKHFGQLHVLCLEGGVEGLDSEMLKSQLPKHMAPRKIFIFDRFSYTKSGKLDRLQTLARLNHAEERVL